MSKIASIMAAAILALGMPACSCGGQEHDSSAQMPRLSAEDDSMTTAQAVKDAEAALALPAGSMERENALLGMRAKEYEMRANGYDAAADRYVAVVDSVLQAAGI